MNMNKNSMYKKTDSVLLQLLVSCLYCFKLLHELRVNDNMNVCTHFIGISRLLDSVTR